MKLLNVISILMLATILTVPLFAEEVERTAKVLELKGSAKMMRADEEKWIPIEVGTVLNQGDILTTDETSTLTLNVNGKGETATIEISPGSQVGLRELVEDRMDGTQKTLLDLAMGKVLIKAQKLHTPESRFEVKTPTSIVGVRGTIFAVEVESLD